MTPSGVLLQGVHLYAWRYPVATISFMAWAPGRDPFSGAPLSGRSPSMTLEGAPSRRDTWGRRSSDLYDDVPRFRSGHWSTSMTIGDRPQDLQGGSSDGEAVWTTGVKQLLGCPCWIWPPWARPGLPSASGTASAASTTYAPCPPARSIMLRAMIMRDAPSSLNWTAR